MLAKTDVRKIKVVTVSVAVACLAVAIFLVDARDKNRPASMPEGLIRSIQEHLALYSKCEFTEISDTEDFFDGLTNRINQLIPDKLSQKKRDALVSFLGNVLVARSEGDWDKYRSALGAGMTAQFPEDLGKVKRTYESCTLKEFPSTCTAESIAEPLFKCESQWDNGNLLMEFCSMGSNGMRASHIQFNAESGGGDGILQLDPNQRDYWLGPIVQGCLVFFRPATDLDMVLRDHDYVDWVDFHTIVKTRGNDMYPLRVCCWYHPVLEHWVIAGVSKQCSMNLMSSPVAAY